MIGFLRRMRAILCGPRGGGPGGSVAILFEQLGIQSQLYLPPGVPGADGGFGTAAAPDPTKNPPTLEVLGSLKLGTTIAAFATDATFDPPRADAVPTQTAVKSYAGTQSANFVQALQERANLGGSATVDFSAADLGAGGIATVSDRLRPGAPPAGPEALSVGGSLYAKGPTQMFGSWADPVTLNAGKPVYQAPVAPGDGWLIASLNANYLSSGGLSVESPSGSQRGAIDVRAESGIATKAFSTTISSYNIISVAVAGDAAVYGVVGDDSYTTVYPLFRVAGQWTPGTPFPSEGMMAFYSAIALSESILAVGGIGIVQIFLRAGTTWNQTDQIPGAANFGTVLAISGSRLIVGAFVTGPVYVYEIDSAGKAHQVGQTLNPPYSGGDWGSAVTVDGDLAVVGDPFQNNTYVFAFDGSQWKQIGAPVSGPAGTGADMDISGTYYIAGAFDSSSAQVFQIDAAGGTVAQIANITSPQKYFGRAVAIHGSILAVGGNGMAALYSLNGGQVQHMFDLSLSTSDTATSASLSDAGAFFSTNWASISQPIGHGLDLFDLFLTDSDSLSLPVRKGDAWQATLTNPVGDCSAVLHWLPSGAGPEE